MCGSRDGDPPSLTQTQSLIYFPYHLDHCQRLNALLVLWVPKGIRPKTHGAKEQGRGEKESKEKYPVGGTLGPSTWLPWGLTYFSFRTVSFSSLWPLWPSEVWLVLLLEDKDKRDESHGRIHGIC
jgi:hypothetical protein